MKKKIKSFLKSVGFIIGALVLLVGVFSIFRSFSVSSLGSGNSSSLSSVDSYSYSLGLSESESYYVPSVATSDSSVSGSTSKSTSSDYTSELSSDLERSVVRSGFVDLYVDDSSLTVKSIREIVKQVDGYVSYYDAGQVSEETFYSTIIVRVPADYFEVVTASIKGLAVEVESEGESADDVTDQYVDMQAQLVNLQAEEASYLRIMESADTVEDTLAVSSKLFSVRDQIERLTARLNTLKSQVSMSTLTIHLSSQPDVELWGMRWEPIVTLKLSLRSMFEGFSHYLDTAIYVLFRLPVWTLWFLTVVGIVYYILILFYVVIVDRLWKYVMSHNKPKVPKRRVRRKRS